MKKYLVGLTCLMLMTFGWIQSGSALFIGDQIPLGTYEQDNNLRNGPEDIWWDILDIRGDYLLLISDKALDCIPYHNRNGAIRWENSDIRNWLVNNFYYTAFDYEDRSCIVTGVFNNLSDPVYMLDKNEIQYYNLAYGCNVSAYAKARGVQIGPDNGKGCWWVRMDVTRSNGDTQFVGIHGKVYDKNPATLDNNGVRPVICVALSILNY